MTTKDDRRRLIESYIRLSVDPNTLDDVITVWQQRVGSKSVAILLPNPGSPT